ncbi:MAG: HD domain-containing protein [Alphaproteobacteria bacterium]|nr:HD domain-containing protein [Alphaproteobacteria bacterium]
MTSLQVNELVDILGKMKSLKRTGWVCRHVRNPESDADHSYSLAILALLLAPKNLDLLKCLKLALVHDMAEVFCGDYMPGTIDPAEKNKKECAAFEHIAESLNRPDFIDLFNEFEAETTPESKFMKALDRVDNIVTASYYQKEQGIKLVEEFTQSSMPRIEKLDDKTKQMLMELIRRL